MKVTKEGQTRIVLNEEEVAYIVAEYLIESDKISEEVYDKLHRFEEVQIEYSKSPDGIEIIVVN